MEHLPIDISLNILSRLPIFSIFHCKLVSRSWRDLADNPLLPRLHFLHQESSQSNLSLLLLHSSTSNLSKDQLYLLENCDELDDNDNNFHHKGVPKRIKIPFKHDRFSSVLHCNGLLFLSRQEEVGFSASDEICIFNAFTKQVTGVPNREVIFRGNGNSVYGFGFDSRTGDYKVVRIVEREIALPNFNLNGFQVSVDQSVEVFTLGTSFWREKRFNNRFLLRMQPSEALINGALYWFGEAKFSHAQIILAFDLGDEIFRQVSNPSCAFNESNSNLVVLGGCLSIVVHSVGKMEIWVLKKYDVKESWIKKFTVGISFSEYGCVKPLCFLKNGKILMEFMKREMLCYDPDAESFKRVKIDALPTLFQAVPHVERVIV